MEGIRLRAHHIGNLKDHEFSPRLTEATDVLYGRENAQKTSCLYDKILEGDRTVTVIDDYDDVCAGCPNRVEGGCNVGDKFYPTEEITEADRAAASEFNVEIGVTYDGKDFLKNVGILMI